MVYSLTYRRPSQVSSSGDSLSGDEKQKSITESTTSASSSCISHGIPEALSFDRIVSGGTCPPCTVRDFMNYLKYIEHSAENLQFFLWFRDYSARFDQLPASEKALAREWTQTQAEAEATGHSPKRTSRRADPNPAISSVFKDTDFADGTFKPTVETADPFNTPDKSSVSSVDEKREMMSSEYGSSTRGEQMLASSNVHLAVADKAFDDAGVKLKPFTMQPYRDEINRVISAYIAKGSPRELNLSDRERTSVMHALSATTHPSAIRKVAITAEYSLRKQAHPNFIRWTICNGNRPRVVFARGLGVFGIVVGFVVDLLLTLSHANRAWRLLPFLAWLIGIATLIAAWKGMCVVLHGLHHRHLRPWELFADDSDEAMLDEKFMSQDSLVSQSTNSFEDEPWIAKYSKRNIIRKVFDREIWIQEPALRQIQDTIFLQAVLASLILSCVCVGIFCAVPHGNFY